MRLVIQRVSHASVLVDGNVVGKIGNGILVLFGVHKDDHISMAKELAHKLVHLRIFNGQNGKMDISLLDNKGELLVVSQFTLYANCMQGRRPDFFGAAPSEKARHFYEHFLSELRAFNLSIQTGLFGAHMQVSLVNDGPVTLILDAKGLT